MVVVIGPVVPPRVIDDAVMEGDAAGGLVVSEAEIAEDCVVCGCIYLGLATAFQPRGIQHFWGDADSSGRIGCSDSDRRRHRQEN